MNRFTVINILMIAALFLTQAHQPPEGKGIPFSNLILSGSVFSVDEKNEILSTLSGAELFLLKPDYSIVESKVSNGLGQYAFLLEENTEYLIIIRIDGYQSQRVKINTLSSDNNHTEELDFRLSVATDPEHLSTNMYLASLLARGQGIHAESISGKVETPQIIVSQRKDIPDVSVDSEVSGTAEVPAAKATSLRQPVNSSIVETAKQPAESEKDYHVLYILELPEAEEVVYQKEQSAGRPASSTAAQGSEAPYEGKSISSNGFVAAEEEGDISFRIQLGRFSSQVSNVFFKGLEGVKFEKRGNYFIYSIGNFPSLEAAQKIAVEVRNLGFKDAFIRAYIRDREASIIEAVNYRSGK